MSQTGGLGIPGLNTSVITNAVASAIKANPAVQQVTSVGEKITSLGDKLAGVKQEAVNAVTKAAGDKVTESLAAAGITPADPGAASGADGGTPEDTANDEGTNEEATNEEATNEEATNEEATNEEATNEEATNEYNEQSGGARYQIILLERPIKDRLFVCYDDGTPIYFTKNSKNKAKLFDPKKATRKKKTN
jgi:cobalamin biosynthesis protein CobT